MSDDDDLRVRLARLDPAARSSDPEASPRAPELLERIMATPVLETTPDPAVHPSHRGRWLAAAAAAAELAAGSWAVDAPDPDPAPTTAGSVLRLSLPDPTVMSSCVQFSTDVLKGMSPAFGGTVTDVSSDHVVLDVDRWYAGGSADRVELALPPATSSASLDGVTFLEGKRFLVTAAGGTVNGCGFSGPATPQLQAAFDDAFGG